MESVPPLSASASPARGRSSWSRPSVAACDQGPVRLKQWPVKPVCEKANKPALAFKPLLVSVTLLQQDHVKSLGIPRIVGVVKLVGNVHRPDIGLADGTCCEQIDLYSLLKQSTVGMSYFSQVKRTLGGSKNCSKVVSEGFGGDLWSHHLKQVCGRFLERPSTSEEAGDGGVSIG